jgi:hypothetical protein
MVSCFNNEFGFDFICIFPSVTQLSTLINTPKKKIS